MSKIDTTIKNTILSYIFAAIVIRYILLLQFLTKYFIVIIIIYFKSYRFAFEPEETTASPVSGSSMRARDGDSPATRFRFDSDSVSPRSMFEDDFTISTPRGRTASIAEEDEGDLPPLRAKPQQHRDIKKSDSVNIFTRESDPFEGDAFFACTGSDRAARRENWPGDFQGFDNAWIFFYCNMFCKRYISIENTFLFN